MTAKLDGDARHAEGLLDHGVGSWNPDAGLGYHRVIISVPRKVMAVHVHVPWRRHDQNIKQHGFRIYKGTGSRAVRVTNFHVARYTAESADIIFDARKGRGTYVIYFLAAKNKGPGWNPVYVHEPLLMASGDAWLTAVGLDSKARETFDFASFPRATATRIESVNRFHSFFPMEVVATADENNRLKARHEEKPFLLFPEDRSHPIRMTSAIPLRWVERGPGLEFHGTAARDEFFTFQIGVWAAKQSVADLSVAFNPLVSDAGHSISSDRFTCFNLDGTDWLGRQFKKRVSIARGNVHALWIGVDIPLDVLAGKYKGKIVVQAGPGNAQDVSVAIDVTDATAKNKGYDDTTSHARLNWLNSTIGINDDVVKPFTPVEIDGNEVKVLGRILRVNEHGLPGSIVSRFAASNDSVDGSPVDILAPGGMRFIVMQDGVQAPFTASDLRYLHKTRGCAEWEVTSITPAFSTCIHARMECDGHVAYTITLRAAKAVDVDDIRLEIPYRKEVAACMMGLGVHGGKRPATHAWKWEVNRPNNAAWIGTVNAGLYFKLDHVSPDWALFNFSATGLYRDWSNEGKGGCDVHETPDGTFLVSAYTGARSIKEGEILAFNFSLLVTPIKILDKDHWNWRYFHAGLGNIILKPWTWLPIARFARARIINVHHGNVLNPHINYPFKATEQLTAFTRKAQQHDVRVKLYYTIRELTNYTDEIWALRSLDGEVFTAEAEAAGNDLEGGMGNPWLKEHLVTGYDPAWHQLLRRGVYDAAIRTTGLSRWHNYYIEGLNWLVRNAGIKGLYLDGIGYDREIMKRVRKVLDGAANDCLIDFHGGNSFSDTYGMTSPACQYLEHFPYINSLWFGEGFDYENSTPEYWLVEVSGIPFGLFGEMLEHGGNPYRGLVFGMTSRLGWTKGYPASIWKLWDKFGIHDAKMHGYWDPGNPVTTSDPAILVTSYTKPGTALLAVASWASGDVKVRLIIDWVAIGISRAIANVFLPGVGRYQKVKRLGTDIVLNVAPRKGAFVIIESKNKKH